ncbi:MAG: hypothetical protein KDM63_09775, partial [Verrucomicrobiae bacterium]|nr:hypothetical protein [Verrucomicrobiae bacterium]
MHFAASFSTPKSDETSSSSGSIDHADRSKFTTSNAQEHAPAEWVIERHTAFQSNLRKLMTLPAGVACWCCLLVLPAGVACWCCLLVLPAGVACWCCLLV